MEEAWYYEAAGERCGPVDRDSLALLSQTGMIERDSLVWTEGMPHWAPAASIKGMFSAPPPLPEHLIPPSTKMTPAIPSRIQTKLPTVNATHSKSVNKNAPTDDQQRERTSTRTNKLRGFSTKQLAYFYGGALGLLVIIIAITPMERVIILFLIERNAFTKEFAVPSHILRRRLRNLSRKRKRKFTNNSLMVTWSHLRAKFRSCFGKEMLSNFGGEKRSQLFLHIRLKSTFELDDDFEATFFLCCDSVGAKH